jgi:hypothetical protein
MTMTTAINTEMRELTTAELDDVAGGLKIGPLNLHAFENGFSVSIDGVAGIWVGHEVCGWIGTFGGCTGPR